MHALFILNYVLHTVCPGSSDPFYIVSYYIKWVTTSLAHRKVIMEAICKLVSSSNQNVENFVVYGRDHDSINLFFTNV